MPRKFFYKEEFDIKELIQGDDDYAIVRRSNYRQEETFDEDDNLKSGALFQRYNEIPGLSMNILGKFRRKHIIFNPTKPANKNWSKFTDPLFLWFKYIWHVEYKKELCPIYFTLSSLHGHSFPFKVAQARLKDSKYNFSPPTIFKGNYVGGFMHSCILHRPNKLNYWHVEFHFTANPGDARKDNLVKSSKKETFSASEMQNPENLSLADQVVLAAVEDRLTGTATPEIDYSTKIELPKKLYRDKFKIFFPEKKIS